MVVVSRMDWQQARDRDAVRQGRVENPIVAWWLTPARAGSRCSECGERALGAIAYNRVEQRVLCEVCVDRLGIVAKPSRALLATGSGRRPPRLTPLWAGMEGQVRDAMPAKAAEIAESTGLPMNEVSACLSRLLARGVVERRGGRRGKTWHAVSPGFCRGLAGPRRGRARREPDRAGSACCASSALIGWIGSVLVGPTYGGAGSGCEPDPASTSSDDRSVGDRALAVTESRWARSLTSFLPWIVAKPSRALTVRERARRVTTVTCGRGLPTPLARSASVARK
jgi:hypothetical protein